MSGNASAWPLYMTIGNVIGSERYIEKNHAMKLIGLLPTAIGNILPVAKICIDVTHRSS